MVVLLDLFLSIGHLRLTGLQEVLHLEALGLLLLGGLARLLSLPLEHFLNEAVQVFYLLAETNIDLAQFLYLLVSESVLSLFLI